MARAVLHFPRYPWEDNTYCSPLVYLVYSNARYYPIFDGFGSTRQLINQTDQAVTDTYSYEAFGNLLASTGTTPNPYRYVGSLGYYQTGSSLMHLGARYYLPEVGRFMSQDPLTTGLVVAWLVQLRGPRAVTRNPYTYGMNDPTDKTDPDGLAPQKKHQWTCPDTPPKKCRNYFGQALWAYCSACHIECYQQCPPEDEPGYEDCAEACEKGYTTCLASKGKPYKIKW